MPSKIDLVIADVIDQIRSGRAAPNSKLPSAAEMRTQYGVSQQTIRTAIERLRGAGWVTTTPGAGVFVAARPPT